MKNYLVFDVGGTNLKFALFGNSKLKEKKKLPISYGIKEFKTQLKQVINSYGGKIDGIAFSIPGKVNSRTSIIDFGGNLSFLDGVDMKKLLEISDNFPFIIENDAKCAALAEHYQGALQNFNNGTVLVLGTSVGGGLIVNGKLLQGQHFQAGEVSFMTTTSNPCGMDQAYGSAGSAVQMIIQVNQVLGNGKSTDGEKAFKAINAHNEKSWRIFQRYCCQIASMIMNIHALLDMEIFAIGGGISAQPILIEEINHQYDEILNRMPITKKTLSRPIITQARFNNDANLYGAFNALLKQNK